MTRKDYIATAKLIRAALCENMSKDAERAIIDIADGMADMFAADNPRFDYVRFLTAAGVIEGGE